MSGESAGDSGKGGSDDDLQVPSGVGYLRDGELVKFNPYVSNGCFFYK